MAGQPARAPEIGSIKVRNSVLATRNLFIINGRVAVVTTYDKSQKRRIRTKYVFKLLPDRLSQLLVQYLVYVLPFTQIVSKRQDDFLFGDSRGRWGENQLSAAVAVATAKHLGVRLTVSGWRQVAIAIGDKHLRRATRIWGDEAEEEEGLAVAEGDDEADFIQSAMEQALTQQAGHGRLAAHNHYAIDSGFLNQLGPDLVHVYSLASRAWHDFLHLESKGAAVAGAVAGTKRVACPRSPLVKRPKLDVRGAIQGLRKILGPDAQPRSGDQAHALELVHTATPDPHDGSSGSGLGPGAEEIHQALQREVEGEELLQQFHQLLHSHCIYCQLMRVEGEEESHCHQDCPYAADKECGIEVYRRWRSRLPLATRH